MPVPTAITGRNVPPVDLSGHRALAAHLRQQILAGHLPPGSRMPSERDLQQTYGLSRVTVRHAVGLLKSEGLVVVRHGQASRVRDIYPKQAIDMAGVSCVDVRMPTPEERDSLGIHEGVPVFAITYRDGRDNVLLPGDRWRIEPSR